jgi:hypothetical protein|tara:strand:+ start:227 stop:406 length:180 start_codon:yes stop_codon:yes gene_type:complete
MKAKAGEFIKTDSGEVIYGSKAFINEIFKTLYGEEWQETIWSYNDALERIKNLKQLEDF